MHVGVRADTALQEETKSGYGKTDVKYVIYIRGSTALPPPYQQERAQLGLTVHQHQYLMKMLKRKQRREVRQK